MLLIKNGKILTMSGKNYNQGSILIKDKKIIKTDIILDMTYTSILVCFVFFLG